MIIVKRIKMFRRRSFRQKSLNIEQLSIYTNNLSKIIQITVNEMYGKYTFIYYLKLITFKCNYFFEKQTEKSTLLIPQSLFSLEWDEISLFLPDKM